MSHFMPTRLAGAGLALALLLLMPLAAAAQNDAPGQDEAFIGAQGQGLTAGEAPAPPPAAPRRPAAAAAEINHTSPALSLLDQGEFAAAAGRFEQAERLWRQALQVSPGWPVAQRRLKELPQRRASFAHDLSTNEARRQARLAFVQGVSEFNLQRYDQALEQFHRFLAVFPGDAEGQGYLDLTRQQMDLVSGGRVVVQSAPRAEVYLDGQGRGWTPLTLERVPPGRHRLEVRAHGGTQAKEITVSGRSTVAVSFTLLGGSLAVNSQPWGEVSLDGVRQGRTPLTLENLVLGPHRVAVSRPGYHEQQQEVILRQDQPQPVSFNLPPR